MNIDLHWILHPCRHRCLEIYKALTAPSCCFCMPTATTESRASNKSFANEIKRILERIIEPKQSLIQFFFQIDITFFFQVDWNESKDIHHIVWFLLLAHTILGYYNWFTIVRNKPKFDGVVGFH